MLRETINWIITIVVFLFVVLALMAFLDLWIAGTIAGAAAFCLHFFILHKRSIGIVCPHCQKLIATNTPWICGYKQCPNENVDDFPFIYQCEHCGQIPKSYRCHHCNGFIFFTADENKFNYAKCYIPEIKATIIESDVVGEKFQKQHLEKLDLQHKLEITMLEHEIKVVKNKPIKPQKEKKSQYEEEMINIARELLNRNFTIKNAVRAAGEEAREKHKDNPHALEQIDALLPKIEEELSLR